MRFERHSIVLVGVFLLAGCGGLTVAPSVTPATSQEVLAAVKACGAKVVLVNLWASWCGPCREEFPDLVRVQRAYEDKGLKVILVSWDDTPAVAARFLAKQGVTAPSLIKSDTENDQKFLTGIEPQLTGALPATLIYDGSGKLRSWWEGRTSYAEFEKKVLEVLNQ